MNLKKKKHLFRDSVKWWLVAQYVFFLMRLFYRKIVVEGRENIPAKGPIIFAPNHQNALMDPLAIHYAGRLQTIFLARADIFKIPVLRDLFSWLKIIPVYRIRDGKENLGNNDASFNIAVEVLENGRSVGIFPEAAHSNQRRLLPLRKGVPRLAFLAEEKNNFNLGVQVMPAGIYFSNYENMRSILHVRFGKPIMVKDFQGPYGENPQKAMLKLRDAIGEQLKELSLNIRSQEYYDAFYCAAEIYAEPLLAAQGEKRINQQKKFHIQKEMINALEYDLADKPDEMAGFRTKMLQLMNLLKESGLKWDFFKLPPTNLFSVFGSVIFLLLAFPVFIYGLVNNILFYGSVIPLINKIKDRQFHSSVKFVWGLAISPLFYIIQSVVVYAIWGSLFWSLIYLLSLPVAGFAARTYVGKFRKTWQNGRILYLKWFNRVQLNKITLVYQQILDDLYSSLSLVRNPDKP
jgi:1-acyl-sn-glycerol-3-phosphate acyltransferase